MRSGDELVVFAGDGYEYPASVESVRGTRVAVAVGEARAVDRESPLAVTLVQCIARADRMDVIVQKATELGVARIVPVQSRRGVVRLDAGAGAVEGRALARDRGERVRAVRAKSSAGRRGAAPPASTTWGRCRPAGTRLLLEPGAEARRAAPIGGEVSIAIGPEGGLDEEEIEAFRLAGFEAMRLGPRVLRTETAAIAALAWLQGRYGDLADG